MRTNILIVGGGLSGLALASKLEQQNSDYHLIEARGRFGGRVHSHTLAHQGGTAYFDSGPSWFWPGQPRIAQLIESFGLEYFDQYSRGDLLYENESGQVERGRGYASMQGSYRLVDGLGKLIESITSTLPEKRRSANVRALGLEQKDGAILTQTRDSSGGVCGFESRKVVIALPPRLAAQTLSYSPDLPGNAVKAMKAIPTWMAGHAKVIAVYDTPFWREAGLSGDAMSRCGPLVEIHDASPAKGDICALFGFVGVPPDARQGLEHAIRDSSLKQLSRLFGPQARSPIECLLQDWAFESETATFLDHVPLHHHPVYGLPNSLSDLWHGNLILSSTEAAPNFGGYLEGALEAAELAFAQLDEAC